MQCYRTVAAVYSASVKYIVTANRSFCENGVAPSVRQLNLTNGLVFALSVAWIHCQCQGNDAVATVHSALVKHIVTADSTFCENGITPGVGQFVLTDGCTFTLVENWVYSQCQGYSAVASIHSVSVEYIFSAYSSFGKNSVTPSERQFISTNHFAFSLVVNRIHC